MNAPATQKSTHDPTLMRNQPSLQTSSGAVWLIVGALFTAVCLVPLTLIAASGGRSAVAAMATIAVIVVLYAAMVVVRLAVSPPRPRLRIMAACFLTLAAVAVLGMVLCVALEGRVG